MLRNPEILEEWGCFDIFVLPKYRRKGIAGAMYEKGISLVRGYDSAERIVASVALQNMYSIQLHEKVGFANIQKKLSFANFQIDETETTFVFKVYNFYTARNTEVHRNILRPIWNEYADTLDKDKQLTIQDLENKLNQADKNDSVIYEIIWCGNRPVGFRYIDNMTKIEWMKDNHT